ncbi:molybdopterin-guanine dinucleotide biosynthesis protein B [Vibrio navarrensis]|nr:molybdopterin-guanine dinucleotide biosynthesis protein MobB [Vibrio navarrensis]MBE3667811.1 molybdopterin-guanine dinucleotide biosynthesis protein B [Vibrio navarrensis]
MMHKSSLALLGFAAYSGTGKTTLLEALLPKLTEAGLRVGVLKHAHHDFDVDKPGKDSYRLRKAGASQMLIASHKRFALMTETPQAEAEFDYLLSRFDHSKLDLLLVEGCKNIAFNKIELHREEVGKPWLYPHDENIIAIASDANQLDTTLPQMNINDLDSIAEFVLRYAREQCHSKEHSTIDNVSQDMLTQESGIERILSHLKPLAESETVPLADAYGRVLALPILHGGDVVTESSALLAQTHLSSLSALGIKRCQVIRKPRVALLSLDGNDSQVCHAVLLGMLHTLGCEVNAHVVGAEQSQQRVQVLEEALNLNEVILLNGSTKSWQHIVLSLNAEVEASGFSLRLIERKPLLLMDTTLVNLQGHFLSTVAPMVRKLRGERACQESGQKARLTQGFKAILGEHEFYYGSLTVDNMGSNQVTPVMHSFESLAPWLTMQSKENINCMIAVPAAVDTLKAGECVTIYPLQGKI